jgi:hypothetical protein
VLRPCGISRKKSIKEQTMNKRILKSIGVAAVVAATAVPSALAMRVIDNSDGTVTPVGVSVKADTSDVFTRYVANHAVAGYDGYKSSYPQLHEFGQSGATVPYLSHGVGVDASQFGGTGVTQTSLRPDDKAGARTSEPSAIVSSASTGNGFNWGDAGAGAGGAIGLFLLLSLGTMISQRSRKGPLAA